MRWIHSLFPVPRFLQRLTELVSPVAWMEGVTRLFSPYDYGPFYSNPLAGILQDMPHPRLGLERGPKFFVTATNVRTGRIRVFSGVEVTVDTILASACLPTLFRAVEIDDPAKAEEWMTNALDNKQLVMGFGHRVYKSGDSRVPTMEAELRRLAERHDGGKWVEMYDTMAGVMDGRTGIKPNLDFPSGPAYHLLGFPVEFFTPLFVLARVTGWAAHIVEQYENNSLIRPLSAYNGPEQRSVPAKPGN